jgi:hypothetical protein
VVFVPAAPPAGPANEKAAILEGSSARKIYGSSFPELAPDKQEVALISPDGI